jgi:hypothetical protein
LAVNGPPPPVLAGIHSNAALLDHMEQQAFGLGITLYRRLSSRNDLPLCHRFNSHRRISEYLRALPDPSNYGTANSHKRIAANVNSGHDGRSDAEEASLSDRNTATETAVTANLAPIADPVIVT